MKKHKLILIVLCILLLIPLGFEFFLRANHTHIVREYEGFIQKIGFINQSPDYLIRHTPAGRRFIPNAKVIIRNHWTSHQDIEMKINSFGFRGPEISKEKPVGTLRAIVLGDSITVSDALPEEQTWVRKAEAFLAKMPTPKKIELINAGVGDIGIKEALAILQEQGLQLKPDYVFLSFYLNDSRPPWGFPGELGSQGLLRRKSLLVDTIYRNLMLRQWIGDQGMHRFAWIKGQEQLDWKNNREAFRNLVSLAQYDWGAAWFEESWNTVEKEFALLAKLAREYHFKPAIVLFPVTFQLQASFLESTPQETAKRLAQKYGFAVFDLFPLLREKTGNSSQEAIYYDHCHFTAAGSEVVAQGFSEFVKNSL